MAITQLSAFLENTPGTLYQAVSTISDAGINLRALSVADTKDFGILRMIVNDEAAAERVLADSGYLIKVIDVVGVKIGDEPGKLSEALTVLDNANINLEYLYAFMARTEKHAYVVIRTENNDATEAALVNAGFHLVTDADVNKL